MQRSAAVLPLILGLWLCDASAQSTMVYTITSPSTQTLGSGLVSFTGTWADAVSGASGTFTLGFQNASHFDSASLLATNGGFNVTLSGRDDLTAHSVNWSFIATANNGSVVNNIALTNGLGSYAKAGATNTVSLTTASGATFRDGTAQNDVVFDGTRLIFPGAGTGDGQGYVQSTMDWKLTSAAGVSAMTGTYVTGATTVAASVTAQEQFIISVGASPVSPVPEPATAALFAVGGLLVAPWLRGRRQFKSA